MVYQPHLKLTMSGNFLNNTAAVVEEIWSCQVNLGLGASAAGPFNTPWTQAQVNAIAAATGTGSPGDVIGTFFGGSNSFINTQCNLALVKYAAIGVDGKYTGNPSFITPNVHGGNPGAPVHPSEVACAVTLRTAQRGSKGRGRFYLPSTDMAVDNTWHISTTYVSELASAVRTMLQQLPGAVGTAAGVAPADVALVVASSSGVNYPVTEIQVGNVYDVIRRRRNKLLETYF